ncbi:MAG: hypothetical protein O7C75_13370, partial [Verrucomicrobia bacterium]|nr:hypothetical protein [Verrucomicrobiota bacterium]
AFEILRLLSIAITPDTGDALTFSNISTAQIPRASRTTLYRLVLNFRESKDELIFSIHYPPNFYEKHGIERLLYNIQHFIRLVIENPSIHLNQFPDLRSREEAIQPLTDDESNEAIMERMPTMPGATNKNVHRKLAKVSKASSKHNLQ